MATATSVKMARNKLDLRVLGRANSSAAGGFDITANDQSQVLVFVECTTSSTGPNIQLHVKASTGGEYSGEGIGEFMDRSTNGAGVAVHYALGPFESSRFVRTSTGGRLLQLKCSTTTGGDSTGGLPLGYKISVVEIAPTS